MKTDAWTARKGIILYSKNCYFINFEQIAQNVLEWMNERDELIWLKMILVLIFWFSLNCSANGLLLKVNK